MTSHSITISQRAIGNELLELIQNSNYRRPRKWIYRQHGLDEVQQTIRVSTPRTRTTEVNLQHNCGACVDRHTSLTTHTLGRVGAYPLFRWKEPIASEITLSLESFDELEYE